jgi:hypothetical protein
VGALTAAHLLDDLVHVNDATPAHLAAGGRLGGYPA